MKERQAGRKEVREEGGREEGNRTDRNYQSPQHTVTVDIIS